MLRTSANIGMVFSFSVAILVSSRTISRQVAFAVFVGTTRLSHTVGASFTNGLHASFYSSAGIMVLAAALSASRLFSRHRGKSEPQEALDSTADAPGVGAPGVGAPGVGAPGVGAPGAGGDGGVPAELVGARTIARAGAGDA